VKQEVKNYLPHASVILVGATVAFSLFGDMAIYAVLPIYYQKLGLTAFQVGILLSSNRWVRLVTNHLAERTARKVHPGILLSISLVLSGFLAAFYSIAPPFILFLLARVLWGLSWSFLRQIGTMTAVSRATNTTLAQVVGFYNGIVRLGFIFGSFFGGMFFDLFGYRLAFLFFSGLTFLGVPFAVSALAGKENRKISPPPAERSRKSSTPSIMFRGFAVGCVGSGIIMSTLGLILKDRIGGSLTLGEIVIGVATLNGILLACRQILASIGAPILGALLDRIGIVKGEGYFFLGAAAVLFLAGVFPAIVALVVLIVLFFVFETALRIALTAESGSKGSKAYAQLATAMDTGSAFGPVLSWTVYQFVSDPTVTLLVAGFLYAVSTVFSFRSPRSGAQ